MVRRIFFINFEEKPSYYLVITGEARNKNLPKDFIMSFNKTYFESSGKKVSCSIWCFDYQIKEAEEILENNIIELIRERQEDLHKEIENLNLLESYSLSQKKEQKL